MDKGKKSVRERRYEVGRFVSSRILQLQGGVLSNTRSPNAVRSLALLRRAAVKEPGSVPAVWNIEFDGMPESLKGIDDRPSRGEWAIHIALTLYAIHQQAQVSGMHCGESEGDWHRGIGNAAKVLRYLQCVELRENGGDADLDEMPIRFSAMVTSESMEELAHYARQLVQQLRAKSIPLDYGRLAGQIFEFQFPEHVNRIRLEWGREYTQRIAKEDLAARSLEE